MSFAMLIRLMYRLPLDIGASWIYGLTHLHVYSADCKGPSDGTFCWGEGSQQASSILFAKTDEGWNS